MARSGPLKRSQKSVGSVWDLEWKVTAVVHGDSYKVAERGKRRNLLVWVSRTSLEKDQQKEFLRHVSRLMPRSTVPVVSHGIDGLGFGYVALELEGYSPIDSDKPDELEVRYRFIECIAKVASFHQATIALENIAPGSFVINADREVAFVGLLGGFAVRDMESVPLDVRACLPHVSMSNTLSGTKADVYALAVLGLRLFGAQFPPSGINPEEIEHYAERIAPSAPRWVSHVLGPIVKHPQRSGLRDAADLLAALADHERKYPLNIPESLSSKKKKGTNSPDEKRAELGLALSVQEIVARARLRDRSRRQSSLRRFIRGRATQLLVICLLTGVTIKAELIPFEFLSAHNPWSSESVTASLPTTSNIAGSERKNPDQTTQSFSNIIDSLERLSVKQSQGGLWQIASKSLVEQGRSNTAKMIASTVGDGGVSARQPAILAQLIDPKLSVQERVERLRLYEKIAPELAGRVGAAFALDDKGEREVYREALISSARKLVAPAAADQISQRSTPALIVVLGGKSELSEGENVELIKDMPISDLWWLLSFHAEKRSDKLPLIFSGALSRGIGEGLRGVFLEVARQAEVAAETPYEALIGSAQRGPTLKDVGPFSEWLAPQSERALYAALLTSTDRSVVTAVLNSLRGKPQLDGLIVDLVDEAFAPGDTDIVQYSFLIGALGLRDSLDRSVVIQGLRSVQDKPLAGPIAQKIFERGDPELIGAALSVFGQLVHPSFLMPLLQHPDPNIRISTVPLVKDLPLASSRAELQSLYAAEEDPRVREVYERVGIASR